VDRVETDPSVVSSASTGTAPGPGASRGSPLREAGQWTGLRDHADCASPFRRPPRETVHYLHLVCDPAAPAGGRAPWQDGGRVPSHQWPRRTCRL